MDKITKTIFNNQKVIGLSKETECYEFWDCFNGMICCSNNGLS